MVSIKRFRSFCNKADIIQIKIPKRRFTYTRQVHLNFRSKSSLAQICLLTLALTRYVTNPTIRNFFTSIWWTQKTWYLCLTGTFWCRTGLASSTSTLVIAIYIIKETRFKTYCTVVHSTCPCPVQRPLPSASWQIGSRRDDKTSLWRLYGQSGIKLETHLVTVIGDLCQNTVKSYDQFYSTLYKIVGY